MVEKIPGSFQMYQNWEILSVKPTHRELPTIHNCIFMSPGGPEPTRHNITDYPGHDLLPKVPNPDPLWSKFFPFKSGPF